MTNSNLLRTIFVCFMLISVIEAQYKNSGIKTSLSARNKLRENQEAQTDSHIQYQQTNYVDHYGGNFKPAEVYMGAPMNQYEESNNYVVRVTQPTPLDPIADFINKTRSQMATGVCYKEVPTATLVQRGDMHAVVGNGTTPNMSRIHACCAGYTRNPHVYFRCEPMCKNDCLNGICTAPNSCVCLPGHLMNQDGNCITTCPLGCANGVCSETGECLCKPGFTLEPQHKKYCVPHCEQSCLHGRCVGPDSCHCDADYRLTAEGTCEPICSSCENGQCTAPGICQCHEGYQKVRDLCEPVCRNGCENGRCTKPDVCECAYGMLFNHLLGKCEPYCDRACVNGICNGHNACQCNEGYAQNHTDWSLCDPVCAQGCPNGYCSAPNLCRCSPGFKKGGIKGRVFCIAA